MKKDIDFGKVEGIFVSIAREDIDGTYVWKVYLINDNKFEITNVIINSKGYGIKDGEEQKTSTLRHFIELIPAKSVAPIETIQPEVFHLNNEYWVSYYTKDGLFDKKFIFVPDSIVEDNIQLIPQLNLEGVLHS